MKKLIVTALLGLVLQGITQGVWAIELGAAKAQGLVGEAKTGYVAAVREPATGEVLELIKDVNGKRRAEFESTAEKTGTTVQQVSHRFYELAVQRTASGNYYQDSSGNWQRK